MFYNLLELIKLIVDVIIMLSIPSQDKYLQVSEEWASLLGIVLA